MTRVPIGRFTVATGFPDPQGANGEYVSSSEVVREALRDWQLRRALHQKELEELRRVWQEGIDSGPGRLADLPAIKAEARRRLEQTGALE